MLPPVTSVDGDDDNNEDTNEGREKCSRKVWSSFGASSAKTQQPLIIVWGWISKIKLWS